MRSPEWNDAALFSCMEEGLNGALPARRNVILKQIMALFGTQILIYGWYIFFYGKQRNLGRYRCPEDAKAARKQTEELAGECND